MTEENDELIEAFEALEDQSDDWDEKLKSCQFMFNRAVKAADHALRQKDYSKGKSFVTEARYFKILGYQAKLGIQLNDIGKRLLQLEHERR